MSADWTNIVSDSRLHDYKVSMSYAYLLPDIRVDTVSYVSDCGNAVIFLSAVLG